ncbi:MAG TPA: DUF3817 domain-containing protein [Ohtaekwangia sp.]|nr:DUF3817 domain-containing protein [Ohtaekwangia sp.]
MKTFLGQLRIIGFLEGLSFLILLGIAMPLKYYWEMPAAVRVVGMAHGVLFVLYIIYVLVVHAQVRWSFKTLSIAILASFVPLGTFYADAKIFRKAADR